MENDSPLWRDLRISDTVVECLFSGFAAGAGMAFVLIIAGLIGGSPASTTMALFSPRTDHSAITGSLAHLAVSGVYGIIFGLGWGSAIRLSRINPGTRISILAGAAFGLMLWLVAHLIILPSSGSNLQNLPPSIFLFAHLVYGALLGWLFGRNR